MKILRRLPLFLVVVGCIAAGVVLGINANASTSTEATAPTWLQSESTDLVRGFVGSKEVSSAVTSLKWAKTTWGQYGTCVGGNGDTGNTSEVYVAVARGEFVSNMTHPPVSPGIPTPPPLAGGILVMTFDPLTHWVMNVDLLHTDKDLDVSALGQMGEIPLAN